MKRYILFFTCLMGWNILAAQGIPADADLGRINPYSFIGSLLLEINDTAQNDLRAGIELAKQKNMQVREDGSVYVDFILGNESDTDLTINNDLLKRLPNVETNTTFANRTSAWVPVDELVEVGKLLPERYRMCSIVLLEEDNQGPELTNSDDYSGSGGDGIRIAIIDGGFDRLTEARNGSAAPTAANTTVYNYTGTGIESGSRHGTGCLETVFDHAPDADYEIYKIAGVTDGATAIAQCIANDVDIISHSLSRYNLGWGDNTGAACVSAASASANGILFFTSAGNRNGEHIQGPVNDPDTDTWHEWNGSGDEQNNFTLGGNGVVRAYLQWNSASSTNNYDLYLYDSNSNLLASSTNSNGFETIVYSNPSAFNSVNVYLAVKRRTGSPPHFELFNHSTSCTDFQFSSTSGSTTSPSNSTAANVISVGAVHRFDYEDPSGTTGIIEDYSSRGPTNSNNQSPDISAPTNTTTVAYSGNFGGTSCATPNAAGMAAAFWSAHSELNAQGVRRILFAKADIYKDWGTNGTDYIYGRGGVFLHDYHSRNRYVLSNAGNTTSSPTLPYYSMKDIDDDAPVANDRYIYYLQTSDSNTAPSIMTKPMLYRSVTETGTIIK